MDAQSIYEMPSVSRCLVFVMLSIAAFRHWPSTATVNDNGAAGKSSSPDIREETHRGIRLDRVSAFLRKKHTRWLRTWHDVIWRMTSSYHAPLCDLVNEQKQCFPPKVWPLLSVSMQSYIYAMKIMLCQSQSFQIIHWTIGFGRFLNSKHRTVSWFAQLIRCTFWYTFGFTIYYYYFLSFSTRCRYFLRDFSRLTGILC